MKKTKTLLCSLLIASMGMGSLAVAQPAWHDARRDARADQREAKRDLREAQRDVREARRDLREARNDRRDARNDRRDAREARYYYNARSPEFRRGGRLPGLLRARAHLVNDWHHHHLARPQPGYHWVQVGPDYVLAAIATGVIASLVLSR